MPTTLLLLLLLLLRRCSHTQDPLCLGCVLVLQDIKLTFLHEAALHLNPEDPSIAEHVAPVLGEVNDNITVRHRRAPLYFLFWAPASSRFFQMWNLLVPQTAVGGYEPEQLKKSKGVKMMLSGLGLA